VDVEEGGYGLDRAGVLGVVEEVALAGLVFGMPFEYVKLGVVCALGGWGFGWGVGEGGGGVWELGRGVGGVWVCGMLSLGLWIVGGRVLLRVLLLEVGGLAVRGGLVGEGHLESVSLVANGLDKRIPSPVVSTS